MYNKLETWIAS